MNDLSNDRFLKLEDVQEKLGISRTTLYRWREEKGLPIVIIGGIKRIREADLQKFLDRHSTDKTTAN
jgi:excisionase family DNA binding protein